MDDNGVCLLGFGPGVFMTTCVKYRYDKVVKYMGSDAETLDLVTPACFGKECLEDVDLETGLQ